MKKLLDYDPLTKTSTFHEYDHSTGKTQIETVQDVRGILDHNKRLANDSSYKQRGMKEDYYHFATVPNVVLMEMMEKHHLDWRRDEDLPKIERLLARDYKKLLTVDKI
jgi:hypothetical protein